MLLVLVSDGEYIARMAVIPSTAFANEVDRQRFNQGVLTRLMSYSWEEAGKRRLIVSRLEVLGMLPERFRPPDHLLKEFSPEGCNHAGEVLVACGQDRPRVPGALRSRRPAPRSGEGAAPRRVHFDLSVTTTHDITPYSEVYGIHPRDVNFARGRCPPAACLADPDVAADSDAATTTSSAQRLAGDRGATDPCSFRSTCAGGRRFRRECRVRAPRGRGPELAAPGSMSRRGLGVFGRAVGQLAAAG